MSDSWRDRLRPRSIAARVGLGVGLLLAVGGALVTVAAFAYGRQAAEETYDRLLIGAANDIAAAVSSGAEGLSVDLPVSAFQLLALAPDDRIAYAVRDPSGAVLTGYENLPAPPADARFYDGDFFGEPARFVTISRRFAERTLSGAVEITVGQTLRAREALALDIARRALVTVFSAGVAMILLAALVIRRALRPLDRMAESFAARDPLDLTPVNQAVPSEAQGMVLALNGFMGRIDRQVETMKRLISDSAHQLRTPVAALRAQADLAAEEPDPARRADIVALIHRRTVDLGLLLDRMLSRALVVHRTDSAPREQVDLRDVALEIFETGDHAILAPGARVELRLGDAPVCVSGDALSLNEAVKNLLGNALRHGRPPVVLGADLENGHGMIFVSDSGPGPSPEILGNTDRFLRAGRSGGTGLGLAIARAVAEAYDGRLDLAKTETGFRAALILPEAR
ncbi:sensor histidine kinase N-terminal domain-containing protein [Litorisediminicola beolgyonensis]|uniref:histidine kinase n=2 Tax=Litorisediminicola beolgyonensis TaxID=1173614 RepID=A0ABW3ZJ63_9RHOB